MNRIIGSYNTNNDGPLLIVLGAMHGNEPAGKKALELLFKMLEVEPITNPNFIFKGAIVGLIGNVQAFHQNKRFIEKDLNRQWKIENIERIKQCQEKDLKAEDLEMKQILKLIDQQIKKYNPNELVVLDLHTTSSHGGIFIIPSESSKSLKYAKEMHAPVVTGFLEGIQGTTLHYFRNENFTIETTAVTFESGQHEEEMAVNRAIAAIVNLMRTIKMVKEDDVENCHDELLIEHSRNLPKVSKLILRHAIVPEDNFKMLPDFSNFQKIEENQQLAVDINGPIHAPSSGRILMPLYQKQGEEGFFLVEELPES